VKIKDILASARTISFEFFPPKNAEGIPAVFRAVGRLTAFQPDFVSVTYGAGGTTRGFTEEITRGLKERYDTEVMAHLTCVGQTRAELNQVLERLDDAGIENIIALRGDPPRGETAFVPVDDGFQHASDLVQHIRENFEFGVAAACYPEGHLESGGLESDLQHTRFKVNQGVDFLITQLFYDNSDFFDFRERAQKAGVDIPIIPGILPILSAPQIRRFTSLCGAKLPPDLDRKLEACADDDTAARELGIEYATRQVEELWDNDVAGVHFYVLNRSYSVSKILQNLGLPGHEAAAGN
jgi:methylenetetrahydrofolate reductase (NADPH)